MTDDEHDEDLTRDKGTNSHNKDTQRQKRGNETELTKSN